MTAARPNSLSLWRDESEMNGEGEEEEEEDFLDAADVVLPMTSTRLLDTIAETQITLNLFMNNRFDEAESRMQKMADQTMYHALGYSTIVFIRAMMTCDRQDMERALNCCKDAGVVIERFRYRFSITDSIYRLSGNARSLTDEELHAELCYAESLLFRAVLTFFNDDSLSSFVRGALKIRSCYQSFKECQRLLGSTVFDGRCPRLRAQFESGTRSGMGTFNLMLSILPSRILRLLEIVGFSGNKAVGMRQLIHAASMGDTLRSTLCALVLLSWHLIITFFVGAEQPDVALCRRLLTPLISNYPRGAIVLFMRARLCIVTGQVENAIHFFNESIRAQEIYRQFHHVCFWELMFAHCYLRQWHRAANYAKRLMDESRWSRAVYTYLMAIVINADITAPKRLDTVAYLLRKVPNLRVRIAGKSIPVEKFCVVKANRFLRIGTLHFAHYEFVYMWGGFNLLSKNYIVPILADIEKYWEESDHSTGMNKDDQGLYLLLRAVCLRRLDSPFQSEENLNRLIAMENELNEHRYLVPYATFELATIRIAEGRRAEAESLLDKARQFTGYPLLSRLHFRIHSATEMLGSRTPMSP